MEIRNIQRTGNMHYFYLPTKWCKEHKITSKSKVSISIGQDGTLTISPRISEKSAKHLSFSLKEHDQDIIHKLIVASYIHPTRSFEITIENDMDFTKLLNQKRLLTLESVEIDENKITCEGSVHISHPELLLKTMIKKIKNLFIVMSKSYEADLIERYEDEIDRSKMLIDKAIISSLTFQNTTKLRTIELYYISLISKELERFVDHLIALKKSDHKFINQLLKPIELLQTIVEKPNALDIEKATEFSKAVVKIKTATVKDIHTYDMERMKQNLLTVSEVIMDWMVTRKMEN